MLRGRFGKVGLSLMCGIAFVAVGCARKELEPTPPEPMRPAAVLRPAPQFTPVKGAAEGVQETGLIIQPLPRLRSRLEIRTIGLPGGHPITLPVEYEGVLELRDGTVAVIMDGKPQPHQRGDMWQVAKGLRLTLQASGEVAVLRAIYLVPGQK